MSIVFDDTMADIGANKKVSPIVTRVPLVYISQFYFKVSKNIRLNATHYFIMKIPNNIEVQQVA